MCTRRLWFIKGQPVLVGRNMDWTSPMFTKLHTMPKGIKRNGELKENPEQSAQWVSKYGGVVCATTNCSTVDGINDVGLSAHLLYLAEADYGEMNEDSSKKGISISLWVQYILDNFATVEEAVKSLEGDNGIMIVPVVILHHGIPVKSPMHVAIEDKTGDSAILEHVKGKLVNSPRPRIRHHGQLPHLRRTAQALERIRGPGRRQAHSGLSRVH